MCTAILTLDSEAVVRNAPSGSGLSKEASIASLHRLDLSAGSVSKQSHLLPDSLRITLTGDAHDVRGQTSNVRRRYPRSQYA